MSSATRRSGSLRPATTTTLTPRAATPLAKASPRPSDAPSTTAHGPYLSAKVMAIPPTRTLPSVALRRRREAFRHPRDVLGVGDAVELDDRLGASPRRD